MSLCVDVWHGRTVLFNGFCLRGHTIVFHPHTWRTNFYSILVCACTYTIWQNQFIPTNNIINLFPLQTITTRLFPYQLQALNWMITRENNTDLAAFWTQVNKNTWFNKGTNCSTDRKPNSPKGGILADDMGLGKTLTVITLIMANHLNGKPMFSRRSSANKVC